MRERKKSLVMKALENPEYSWRTARGIAEETGLDAQTVQDIIQALGKEIVQSKVPSEDGEELFTTSARLKPLVIGALKNPKYDWRTVLGIATETRLAVQTVKEVLTASRDQVIKAKHRSEAGEDLYSVRSR